MNRRTGLARIAFCALSEIACAAFAATAAAQSAAPAEPASNVPTEAAPDPEWARGYESARRLLYAEDFARAEVEFDTLAATAKSDADRRLATELASLCRSFAERRAHLVIAEPPASTHRASKYRTSDELAWLYIASVGYGLGTGAWLAVQTRPESTAGIVLPALGLAGAAAAGVALADTGRPLKYGVPQAITTGLELGLGEGVTWTLWNQAHANRPDEWGARAASSVVWGATTVGGITGGVVGSVAGTTPGRTSLVGSAGLWMATVVGLVVAGASGDDHGQRDDNALLAAGIALNAGAVGGALLAGPLSPSVARVRFVDLGAIAGGVLAGGLYVSASNGLRGDHDGALRGFYATTGLGIAAGIATATYFTRTMAPDPGPSSSGNGAAADSRAPITIRAEPTLLAANGGAMLGAVGTF